ncbi:MAG TPA: arginase family protein [Phototrophicaceae bacterium]|jgi:arginase|nr:arginase family protein [Phototrophicaceae bacterium]
MTQYKYICIGVPYWIGDKQSISAVDAVKNSGIVEEIGATWFDIQPDFTAYSDPVVAVNRALADVIASHPDQMPLIFAGDCVCAIGSVKGLESKHPAVLWYDAHGDFNTPEISPSGFLGGMSLAVLVGRGNEILMQGVGLNPLAESDVIITDARDLDPEEAIALANSSVTHLKNIDELLTYPLPDKPLYIHFDTDVVTPEEMPALSYPTSGGPSMARALATIERVGHDAEVAGILFSLWKHTLDGAKMSLQNTLELVRTLVNAQSQQS